MALSTKELLTCRRCKLNRGEIIYSYNDSRNKKKTRFYLHCLQCNAKRAKIYRGKNPDKIKGIVSKYEAKNQKKRKAWDAVAVAIRNGSLVKPKKCSKCPSKEIIQAHHEDYSKPLEVEWLCCKCHKQIHKEHGNI